MIECIYIISTLSALRDSGFCFRSLHEICTYRWLLRIRVYSRCLTQRETLKNFGKHSSSKSHALAGEMVHW